MADFRQPIVWDKIADQNTILLIKTFRTADD
jgi:hypothetical protein